MQGTLHSGKMGHHARYLDGVGSELIDEIAVEGLHETEGEGNLGHAAVDLLGELGEATVPHDSVGENIAEDEALAVLGEGLGLEEAEDLLGLRVATEDGARRGPGSPQSPWPRT